MTYPAQSWLSPKLEVQRSLLQRHGLFARQPMQPGEVVVIWGGTCFTEDEIAAGLAAKYSYAAIDEGIYLGTPIAEGNKPDDFMNHSCDPNVWLADERTLVARREIRAGEELTADYALWESDEEWAASWACRCGSELCRQVVTGRDWRRPDLQARYRGHFSPFIERRIQRLQASP